MMPYQRFARTLEEAFGPYTSHDFDEQGPTRAEWALVIGAVLFVLTVFIGLWWYFSG